MSATALPAITCISGPPWMPGMIMLSITSDHFLVSPFGVLMPRSFSLSLPTKIMPPRGPRSVLWVVVVVKSAMPMGLGCLPVATRPAMWAMSTIRYAPTSSAARLKASKSMIRE